MKKLIFATVVISSALFGNINASAQVAVGVSVRIAPPVIPVYVQPPCPYDGYIWSPGYWAWGPNGYYWVPGTWVLPPEPGYLWTPGYWGFVGGVYGWYPGYWGLHVGYYGGICYGFGYPGVGFYGGRWEGGAFRYNTAVWRVNGSVIHNTYVDRAGIATSANRASFNGPGGVKADPTASERAAMNEHHIAATSAQKSHQVAASKDRNQLASVNHGRPATTAMSTPKGQRFNQAGRAATSATTHANTNNAAHTSTTSHATTSHTSAPHSTASHSSSASHTSAAHTSISHASTPHTSSAHTSAPQHRTVSHSSTPQHTSTQQHRSAPQQHAAPRGGGSHGGGAPHGGGGGGDHHEGGR